VTILYALERWLASVKTDSDSGNEHYGKYKTAAKHIGAWARSKEFVRLSQITPDALDHWKSLWTPKAKNPDDRISKTTAGLARDDSGALLPEPASNMARWSGCSFDLLVLFYQVARN
jgi:hypothetical protein